MYPVPLPSGIGAEGSGVIKKIGSKVKDFSVSDHVAYAGAPLGAYSSERIYPTKNLVKIPDYELDFEIAATLMTKGLTTLLFAYIKLILFHQMRLYYFMLQLAVLVKFSANGQKALGCKVIGTVGSDEKIRYS